jgi:hypothetical protein
VCWPSSFEFIRDDRLGARLGLAPAASAKLVLYTIARYSTDYPATQAPQYQRKVEDSALMATLAEFRLLGGCYCMVSICLFQF